LYFILLNSGLLTRSFSNPSDKRKTRGNVPRALGLNDERQARLPRGCGLHSFGRLNGGANGQRVLGLSGSSAHACNAIVRRKKHNQSPLSRTNSATRGLKARKKVNMMPIIVFLCDE